MIYIKTDGGKEEIKVRSMLLSPKQRSALILTNAPVSVSTRGANFNILTTAGIP